MSATKPRIYGVAITHVKEKPDDQGWAVNRGQFDVPRDSSLARYILQWIEMGGVVEPDKTDDELSDGLHAYTNVARDRAEQSGFSFNGWRFDSDAVSVARIIGAALAAQGAIAAGQPLSIGWTDADNETRQLNAMQLVGLQQALVIHSGTCHEIGRQLKAAVEAGLVTSREEIDAAPWP